MSNVVKTYSRKPPKVQAIQAAMNNIPKVEEFVGGDLAEHSEGGLVVAGPSGGIRFVMGDYIVRGEDGEYRAYKPEVFVELYEVK